MSNLDLDAIEARANAATEGPWAWETDASDEEEFLYHFDTPVLTASGMHTEGYVYISAEDAEFIARARTDVPEMSKRIRELDAEVERLSQRPSVEGATEAARREIAKGEYMMGGESPLTYRPYQHSAERAVRSVLAMFPTAEGGDTE